jgi:serine/threonine-protein kinase
VRKLYAELLGSHPSIQRIREAVRDEQGTAAAVAAPRPRPPRRSAPDDGAGDGDRVSVTSAVPADSIPPPVPTAQQLEDRGPQRQIGRGELFMEIAQDEVATVHMGRWLGAAGFARLIAVTMLRKEYASDEKLVAAYLADARTISRVRHPNLVPIHDVIEDGGELLVVTDYVPGVTLAQLLRQLKRKGELMPIGVASRIVSDVLAALHAAHSASDETGASSPVIHQNVCPDTVIVGDDGLARLTHFGVERGLVAAGLAGARAPACKAPEQLLGEAVDLRTDVYGAAAVAYHLYGGRQPFRGENAREQIIAGKPRALAALREALPPKLEALVSKGMARARLRAGRAPARWQRPSTISPAWPRGGRSASGCTRWRPSASSAPSSCATPSRTPP